MALDVRTFEGDFAGFDIGGGDDGGNDGAQEKRGGEDEKPAEPAGQNGSGGDEAGADFEPQQRQDNVLVDVIDADEEAMVVAQESEAVQIETHGEEDEEQGDGDAEEARFQGVGQVQIAKVDHAAALEVGQRIAHFPEARGEPIEDGGEQGDGFGGAQGHGVEREFEQVKGEGQTEGGIAPFGGAAGQAAAAEVADGDPGVHGGEGDEDGEGEQDDGGDFGVEGVAPETRTGGADAAGMGDPEYDEGDDAGDGEGCHAIDEHVDPSGELVHLAPPLELNDGGGDGAGEKQRQDDRGDQITDPMAAPAAPFDFS